VAPRARKHHSFLDHAPTPVYTCGLTSVPRAAPREGMMKPTLIDPERLFPAEATSRRIAISLYNEVASLPIISPHGHTQAAWFARNEAFPDPARLFVQPDHYIFRMLYSQGFSLEDLEIGQPELKNPRRVWQIFASNYYLFRGTPT